MNVEKSNEEHKEWLVELKTRIRQSQMTRSKKSLQ